MVKMERFKYSYKKSKLKMKRNGWTGAQNRVNKLEDALQETEEISEILPEKIDTESYGDMVLEFCIQKGIDIEKKGKKVVLGENTQEESDLIERIYRLATKILKIQREREDPTPYIENILNVLAPLEDRDIIRNKTGYRDRISNIFTQDKQYQNFIPTVFLDSFGMLLEKYQGLEQEVEGMKGSPSYDKRKSGLIKKYKRIFDGILEIAEEYIRRFPYELDKEALEKFRKEMRSSIRRKLGLESNNNEYKEVNLGYIKYLANREPKKGEKKSQEIFEEEVGKVISLDYSSQRESNLSRVHIYFGEDSRNNKKSPELQIYKNDSSTAMKKFLVSLCDLALENLRKEQYQGPFIGMTVRAKFNIENYL